MVVPVSTPAGILIESVRSRSTRFLPLQVLHGSVMILPSPPQREQVRLMLKNPCCILICPCPLQVVQVLILSFDVAPSPSQSGQRSQRGMRILVEVPKAASSKLILRLYRRSSPAVARDAAPAASEELAEDVAEDVAHPHAGAESARPALGPGSCPVLVVIGALLTVRQALRRPR